MNNQTITEDFEDWWETYVESDNKDPIYEAFVAGVKLEREACAKIADKWNDPELYGLYRSDTGAKIAKSIREHA